MGSPILITSPASFAPPRRRRRTAPWRPRTRQSTGQSCSTKLAATIVTSEPSPPQRREPRSTAAPLRFLTRSVRSSFPPTATSSCTMSAPETASSFQSSNTMAAGSAAHTWKRILAPELSADALPHPHRAAVGCSHPHSPDARRGLAHSARSHCAAWRGSQRRGEEVQVAETRRSRGVADVPAVVMNCASGRLSFCGGESGHGARACAACATSSDPAWQGKARRRPVPGRRLPPQGFPENSWCSA